MHLHATDRITQAPPLQLTTLIFNIEQSALVKKNPIFFH